MDAEYIQSKREKPNIEKKRGEGVKRKNLLQNKSKNLKPMRARHIHLIIRMEIQLFSTKWRGERKRHVYQQFKQREREGDATCRETERKSEGYTKRKRWEPQERENK